MRARQSCPVHPAAYAESGRGRKEGECRDDAAQRGSEEREASEVGHRRGTEKYETDLVSETWRAAVLEPTRRALVDDGEVAIRIGRATESHVRGHVSWPTRRGRR